MANNRKLQAAARRRGGGKRNSRNGGRKGTGGRPSGNRSLAMSVLAPGVAATVPRPFGHNNSIGHYWDAKMPSHLPLPRAVGPYTVVRATRRFSSTSASVLLGCFKESKGGPTGLPQRAGLWSTTCALTSIVAGNPLNGALNATEINLPLDLGDAATICPSAFSVQIMNPNALQTTSGIVYAGTMHTQANIADRSDTWDQYFDKFVNYQSPRLLAAPRLALKGVQVNSYPLNMTDVSEFTTLSERADGSVTLDVQFEEPTGWAPIMVYNPNSVDLEFLVTTEWRVRFDLNNPASSTHVHHPVASDSLWNRMIQQASSMGHGVIDIAERVANIGAVASSVIGRLRPPPVPMLVD